MALTKVQAEGINLADAFAFTGSVTGASILQVKGTTSASESTTDSSSFVANGLSALSITPSSASNKVLILFGVHLFQASGGGSACLTLFRDSTDLNNTTYGWGYTNSGSPNFINGALLDNPNTTSSVSYQIKHRVVSGSGNVYSQINNNTSTFTIMEIGSPILT
tara:strand:- start:510 stop:1001 length:492 start_codon:yes stop_codon:yes gene_type:complete